MSNRFFMYNTSSRSGSAKANALGNAVMSETEGSTG